MKRAFLCSFFILAFLSGQDITAVFAVANPAEADSADAGNPADRENSPPVAVIDSVSPNPALPGETVTFSGRGLDRDGSIRQFHWRTENGALSREQTFSITPLSPGIKTIFLRVRDDRGEWSSETSRLFYHLGCEAPVRIMPLGDSITYGVGEVTDSNLMAGYRQPLHKMLVSGGYNIDFVGERKTGRDFPSSFDTEHQGEPGSTDDKLARNVYKYLSANPADIVLLHTGTNGTDPDTADLERVLDEIDRFSLQTLVILARIINEKTPAEKISSFNEKIGAMVRRRAGQGDKIILVDQEKAVSYPEDLWDSSHPKNSGYIKMAAVWFKALQQLLPLCRKFPPFIYTQPQTTGVEGRPYTYKTGSTGKPAPVFRLLQSPAEMTLDPVSGVIDWSSPSPGRYNIEIEAGNDIGSPDFQAYTLEIYPRNIIENGDPLRTSQTGTWMISGAGGCYGPDSLYSYNGATYTWIFSPEAPGEYEVQAWWTSWPSRTDKATYVVEHSKGATTVSRDQGRADGRWNSLGVFYFETGRSYKLTLISQPYPSSTCADAVRFTHIRSTH